MWRGIPRKILKNTKNTKKHEKTVKNRSKNTEKRSKKGHHCLDKFVHISYYLLVWEILTPQEILSGFDTFWPLFWCFLLFFHFFDVFSLFSSFLIFFILYGKWWKWWPNTRNLWPMYEICDPSLEKRMSCVCMYIYIYVPFKN